MGGAAKALRAPKQDKLRSPVGVRFDVIIPEPNDSPAVLFQECRSLRVVSRRRFSVLTAIEFNRQPRFAAGQIDDVRADNELPGESRPVLPQPQPKQALRLG